MKNKMKILLIVLGVLLFVLSFLSSFVFNFNFGLIVTFGISCGLITYGVFYDRLIKIKLLSYSILLICIVSMGSMLFIYFYGSHDNVTFDEDVVIVLGAAVRGERVSLTLARRLDKAVEYHSKNPDAVIIVSGGQGFQEDITEAEAMARYLIHEGIPEEIIIQEAAATSTYENLLYAKEILGELFEGEYKTVVITNDFHIFRATQLARKLGYDMTHEHAQTDWYSVPMNYFRECLAIVKMWVLLDI